MMTRPPSPIYLLMSLGVALRVVRAIEARIMHVFGTLTKSRASRFPIEILDRCDVAESHETKDSPPLVMIDTAGR